MYVFGDREAGIEKKYYALYAREKNEKKWMTPKRPVTLCNFHSNVSCNA